MTEEGLSPASTVLKYGGFTKKTAPHKPARRRRRTRRRRRRMADDNKKNPNNKKNQ